MDPWMTFGAPSVVNLPWYGTVFLYGIFPPLIPRKSRHPLAYVCDGRIIYQTWLRPGWWWWCKILFSSWDWIMYTPYKINDVHQEYVYGVLLSHTSMLFARWARGQFIRSMIPVAIEAAFCHNCQVTRWALLLFYEANHIYKTDTTTTCMVLVRDRLLDVAGKQRTKPYSDWIDNIIAPTSREIKVFFIAKCCTA